MSNKRTDMDSRRTGRINATVLPAYEVAAALFAQSGKNRMLNTASRVVEEALHEFFLKHDFALPTREQVAAYQRRKLKPKRGANSKNGGSIEK